VKSENVAGVYTKTLPGSGALIAVSVAVDPFDPADATLEGVLGTDQLRAEVDLLSKPDKVYIWNGSGYNIYWLAGDPAFWKDATGPTNPPLETGSAFWVKSHPQQTEPLEITITGQAIEASSVTTPIAPGLQMISYAFSSDVGVNDTTFIEDGAAKEEGLLAQPDKLYLWDNVNGGYTILKVPGGADYWEVIGGPGGAADEVISLGDGFWYSSQTNSYSWSEDNQYLQNL
jgi:hypothetical protein